MDEKIENIWGKKGGREIIISVFLLFEFSISIIS